jgi:hypothetical protein
MDELVEMKSLLGQSPRKVLPIRIEFPGTARLLMVNSHHLKPKTSNCSAELRIMGYKKSTFSISCIESAVAK